MRYSSLTPQQRRILAHLAGASAISLKEVAKRTRSTEFTIRRIFEKARELKWLRPTTLINHSTLGLQTFNVFFSCPRDRAAEVAEFLKTDPRVVWATENVGYPRFQLTAVSKHASEMTTLFSDISRTCGTVLTDRSWVLETSLHYWGNRFLSGEPTKEVLTITHQDPASLALIDLKILDALRTAECSHITALARSVKQPASTIGYRINRLLSHGVISPTIYRLDASRAGLVCCEYLLTLSRVDRTLEIALRNFCESSPEVMLLIPSFGMWDYKMEVVGENLEQLDQVRDRLETALPHAFSSIKAVFRRELLTEGTYFERHPDLRIRG